MNDLTAHQYAVMAGQVYSLPPTIGAVNSSARAVVSGDQVGFRGTDNVVTWLADMDFSTITVPQLGRLHEGFWGSFSSIAGKLMQVEHVDVCYGHSEGAALALLYAAELCRAGRPPSIVYAFEPPRVSCDDTLAKLFAANGVTLFLTQHGNDIVPMVPRITEPWQHPGPLAHIGTPSLPFPNVDDHLIAGVIKALAP